MVIHGTAQLTQSGHFSTAHETQHFPAEHPSSPSCRVDGDAVGTLLGRVDQHLSETVAMPSHWATEDGVDVDGGVVAARFLQEERLQTVGGQCLFEEGNERG